VVFSDRKALEASLFGKHSLFYHLQQALLRGGPGASHRIGQMIDQAEQTCLCSVWHERRATASLTEGE
jgi:hypothetical protein